MKNVSFIKIIACALCIMGFTFQPAQASSSQFIAKIYTEALGRAPDAGAWNSLVDQFATQGCSYAMLSNFARSVYASNEYNNLGYDNYEKVLTAYRGVFSREPDGGGVSTYVNYLNAGNSLASLIDIFTSSSEFANKIPAICSPLSYGWGTHNVYAFPTVGSGFAGGSSTQLQFLLNSAAPGSTVYLAQRAVVYADTQIVVPAGVTLATTGMPNRYRFAKQARIVRTALFGTSEVENQRALIKLMPGAKLNSVWVTGQRQKVGFTRASVNIYLRSGKGGAIQNVRTDDAAGFSTAAIHGKMETNLDCSGVNITGNLSTGYTNTHTGGNYTDGFSVACESSIVAHNHIVDASDVGIVLFRATPAIQKSKVYSNLVVSAGVPAYGAYVVDPLQHLTPTDFTGSSLNNNVFWAAPDSHFDVGISVGTMAWFGKDGGVIGTGASVSQNTTGGVRTPMRMGLLIDGMLNAYVHGNDFLRSNPEGGFNYYCPLGDVLTDVASGHASGDFQPWTQVDHNAVHGCVHH